VGRRVLLVKAAGVNLKIFL